MSLDDLCDELGVVGVHEGFPAERRALAGKLYAAGCSPDDVRILAEHVARTITDKAKAAAALAKLLSDDRERGLRLDDLRKIVDLRAKRGDYTRNQSYHPGPTEGEARESWEHDRRCRIAWCRINGDRHRPADVARDLGVDVVELERLLERGRKLSVSDAPKGIPKTAVKAAEASAEERAEQWKAKIREIRGWNR